MRTVVSKLSLAAYIVVRARKFAKSEGRSMKYAGGTVGTGSMSFPRTRESRLGGRRALAHWIPAFAGVTKVAVTLMRAVGRERA